MRPYELAPAASLIGHGDLEAAERACRVLCIAPLRIEILRFVLCRTEVSAATLMKEFGLTRNGALSHIKVLAEEDLLTQRRATHPRGSGPITYWRADRAGVQSVLETLTRHVLNA